MSQALKKTAPLQVQERLRHYRRLLTRLVRSEALSSGDIEASYRQVTELGCELLGVERAGVWRFDGQRRHLVCVDLFERIRGAHSAGTVIAAEALPAYFRALEDERCLVVPNTFEDPRTQELVPGYLRPLKIGAMLDAPIWIDGRVVGVVCHEHVGGPRAWDFTDELLAGTIADFVARVIEVGDRQRAEQALGAHRRHGHELQAIKSTTTERVTNAVEREVEQWRRAHGPGWSDGELQALFDASPVPLVLTGLGDAVVRYANRRAKELFEFPGEEMIGRHAPEFYVDPHDRSKLIDGLRAEGRVEGVIAQLKTRHGRPFWALMSAQCVAYQKEACFMVGFSDVTVHKLAEDAVRQSEANVRALLAAAPVALILSRAKDQAVLLANQRAADLFEMPLEQALGQKTPDYYVDMADRDELLTRLGKTGLVEDAPVRMRTARGREFWALFSGRALDYQGDLCFLVGLRDITNQKELEEQLRHLATRDPLTGVFNRRQFVDFAQQALVRASQADEPLSVLMIDVDHFKRVNDEHGHATGDQVLAAIAKACEGALRGGDVLARVGGEEFAALLPGTDRFQAEQVAERLRSAMSTLELPTERGATVRPTLSVGVASWRQEEDLDRLLRRADRAMYDAKQAGRNRVATASE